MPRTIIRKLWDAHVVRERSRLRLAPSTSTWSTVTSPQAPGDCATAASKCAAGSAIATLTTQHSDHRRSPSLPIVDEIAEARIAQLEANCREFGVDAMDRAPSAEDRASLV
ncbi:MAG: hypothetical protein U0Q18_02660 [Bryobacteraceae bacterium]